MKELSVIGRAHERREALGHVAGSTTYVDDVSFPGMCHMKAVRSPLPHARIRGIDFSEAEEVPGFVTYLTAADVPKNVYTVLCLIGVEPDEEQVLAAERVRYVGEPIAVVVAESEAAACEAARRVKLDLEELPAVFDVEEALEPGAPVVTHWGTNYFVYEGHHCRRVRYGDAAEAREQADHVISGRYQLSPIEHAPIEPTGCVAKPEADGRVTVHTNTQAIFFSLDNTAIILQIPPHRLRFVGGTVGGGFGGKVDVIVEPLAALAALRTGRPIRYVYTREEEMQVSSTRSASRIYITDGVMDDGMIVSREVTSYEDAGAYSRHTPYGCTKHAANAAGPYTIPNVSIDVHCVYTNRVPSSAMRGFGVTEASFALELQMDRIARELGIDPWELRLRQAYRNGDERPYRKETEDATLVETIQAAAELAGDELPAELREMTSNGGAGPVSSKPGQGRVAPAAKRDSEPARILRGRGIAAVNYPTGMNLGGDPSQALIHSTPMGSFMITLSSADLGQGLRTVMAQIGAEAMGVPLDTVHVDTADSDTGPHCMGTFASRATHRVGNAIIAAANEAKEALMDVAAEELEAAPEDLETDGEGSIRVAGVPGRSISISDVALAAHFKHGRTISGRGLYMKPKSEVDPETGAMDPDSTEAHACTVAEVEVDTETGQVRVLSLRSAYEVGRAINPALVQGQIRGGAWMGVSHALYETTAPYYPEIAHSPADFTHYLMPGAAEVPEIESTILEVPSVNGPYGMKGVGEMTANSPIPAIANAITDAIGVQVTELPITPEKVLRALEERDGQHWKAAA